jgi:outer membrane protein OmpA-like peptidoglycan-associated protein
LFFSSDGHPGLGGLDIFSATGELTEWSNIVNLAAPLNSSFDDFALVYDKDEETGYFTSNRPGGKGSDDIYQFKNLNKWNMMAGRILFSDDLNDPAANIKIMLSTPDGALMQTTTTSSNGFFQFRYLPPDEKFMMQLEETDPRINIGRKIFLADANGNIVKMTTTDEERIFTFYNLPFEPYKQGDLIVDDTRLTLFGNVLIGQNPAKPLAEQVIEIVNSKGEKISSTITDEKGTYKFRHLPPDENLAFFLPENDVPLSPNKRIIITDKTGNVIKTIYTDSKGRFNYQLLAADYFTLEKLEEKDIELKNIFKGKIFSNAKLKTPAPNLVLSLVDKTGVAVVSTSTDSKGNFQFDNIKAIQNHTLTVDNEDANRRFKELFLADYKGNILSEIMFKNAAYSYEILPSDAFAMKIIVEDDKLQLKGKLFANTKGNPSVGTTVMALNEDGKVVQVAETDASGNFKFLNLPQDQNYTLKVDLDDTNIHVKEFLFADSKGNVLKQLSAGDGFEFILLPEMVMALTGVKEQDTHLQFDIKGKIITDILSKNPAGGLDLILVDEQGRIVRTATTKDDGYFRFARLEPNHNYSVELNSNGQSMKYQVLYLTDLRGNIIKKLKGEDGQFKFALLASDVKTLRTLQPNDTELKITMKGKIYIDENGTVAAGAVVNLLDEQGDVIQRVLTDAQGNFVFVNLPPDNNYSFSVENNDTFMNLSKIYLADAKGNVLREMENSGKGFVYKILPPDMVALGQTEGLETILKLEMRGRLFADNEKNIPAVGAFVSLVDDKGNMIQKAYADKSGSFRFINLPPDHNYSLQIGQPQEGKITYKNIFLVDKYGNTLKSATFEEDQDFKFVMLPAEYAAIQLITAEDTWIKIKDLRDRTATSVIKIEYIYFAFNSFEIMPESTPILDKAVKTMMNNPDFFLEISGHTDSRGSDVYNQWLSERRADAAKRYIIEQGINPKRMTSLGLGESMLLNHCGDDVNCPPELHQENRRTEFKISIK